MRKFKVTLEQQERDSLVAITQKGNHPSRKVLHALILLHCDQGRFQDRCLRNEDVAAVLKISRRKIDGVKKRFVEEGLDVALQGRKGQRVYEKKTAGDFEAHLVALSCRRPPEGFSPWSLRRLADRVVALNYIDSISYQTVRRILKKTKSSPGKRKGGSFRQSKTLTLSLPWKRFWMSINDLITKTPRFSAGTSPRAS